ncbi:MAG: hypothetical protein RIS64_2651 [Bacteroidota bacterium]
MMTPIKKQQSSVTQPLENALTQSWGFRLFQQICVQSTSDANTFISPMSLQIALGMSSHGACGKTLKEINEFIGLHTVETPQRLQYFQDLLKIFSQTKNEATLLLANSIWVRDAYPPKLKFKETVETVYQSEVKMFSPQNAAKAIQRINEWCAKKTNHKISKILESIVEEDVMFLLNALYFKAKWAHKFLENKTQPQLFHGAGKEPYLVSMMQQKAQLNYFEDDTFQMVEFPYKDAHFSIVFLLPKTEMDAFLPSFHTENWSKWLSEMESEQVALELPKFKMEFSVDMIPPLKNLQLITPFDELKADFNKLCEMQRKRGNVFIAQITQKTCIEVTEEGTEAAAVTMIRTVSKSAKRTFIFKMNRPFLFVIKENQKHRPIFMGKMMNIV